MEKRIVMNALSFLERTTLKGNEVDAYLEVKYALTYLIKNKENSKPEEGEDVVEDTS